MRKKTELASLIIDSTLLLMCETYTYLKLILHFDCLNEIIELWHNFQLKRME